MTCTYDGGPMMARRRPIFDPRQKVADICPWSVRVWEEKVSPLTVTCTYDGQTLADFWPGTKSCRRLAVVGKNGKVECRIRIGESTYDDLYLWWQTYDGQTSADFWPETKSCRRLSMVGESVRRKVESTNHDVYFRRPDVGRFLTWDKKLPTSGRGQ